MIKSTLAAILASFCLGCASIMEYKDGQILFAQGKIEENKIIKSSGDFFTLPMSSSPMVENEGSRYGIFFTITKRNIQNAYVVSGSLEEVTRLKNDFGISRRVTMEFYPKGEYKPLPSDNFSTNRFFYSRSIPRKNCSFTIELIK